MSSTLTPRSLNHVAYLTTDTAATHRFYTEVLGCKLVAAVEEDEVPSVGEDTSFLHTFFAMQSGECFAFFEIDGQDTPAPDGVPSWVRHIALTIGSLDELDAWREHVSAHGVEVRGPVDHEGIWTSIYFFDPNGVRIELTHQNRALTDEDAAEARELLGGWAERHGRDLAAG